MSEEPENDKVIYASGVSAIDAEVLRTFAAKNGKTFSKLMHILAVIVTARPTEWQFDNGKAGEVDPRMEQFDIMLREFMQKQTPEEYRKFPILRRWFGKLYSPLTRIEFERCVARVYKPSSEEEKKEIMEQFFAPDGVVNGELPEE